MKSNIKKFKKITILFPIILLIIILFLFLNKVQDNKINANDKGTLSSGEVDKNEEKTSVGNDATIKDASEQNQTSDGKKNNKDTKAQEKDQSAEGVNNEMGITIFVKDANFGSTVEMLKDNSKFSTSYKYYQFFLGNKPISNMESISKNETVIYPAQEVGSEVVVKLLDENKKTLKELNVKLSQKK